MLYEKNIKQKTFLSRVGDFLCGSSKPKHMTKTIEIIRGYRINYWIEETFPGCDRYSAEWTAHRENHFEEPVRILIEHLNKANWTPDEAAQFVRFIKSFII